MEVLKFLDNNESGHTALSWVLYFGYVIALLIGYTANSSLYGIITVILIILGFIRLSDTSDSIPGSHIRNFLLIAILNFMLFWLVLLGFVGAFGIGSIALLVQGDLSPLAAGMIVMALAGPVVFLWTVYRLVLGILKLREGQGIPRVFPKKHILDR